MAQNFPNAGGIRLTRRATLAGLGAALTLGRSGAALAAGSTTARLVVINTRGGLDGLATVIPYGDPYLQSLRASLVPKNFLKLDNFWALHPSMPNLNTMYNKGEALAVHAVSPIAPTRSHFEGQDYMQSGAAQLLTSGWLSRVLGVVPVTGSIGSGMSVDAAPPLLIRGNPKTAGYAPDHYHEVQSPLKDQILALTASDSLIGPAMQTGLSDRGVFDSILGMNRPPEPSAFINLCGIAGSCLGSSTGPRIAALETGSMDTHSGQNDDLPASLSDLDQGLALLKANMGATAWAEAVVLTFTEFGRTAYVNGTGGTDHGTGFALIMAGGAVAGGRVVANWPGLGPAQLYQGRDLAPTVDFRSIAMGVLRDHLGVATSAFASIFPGSTGISPYPGLVKG